MSFCTFSAGADIAKILSALLTLLNFFKRRRRKRKQILSAAVFLALPAAVLQNC
jgi:hypothetical protein